MTTSKVDDIRACINRIADRTAEMAKEKNARPGNPSYDRLEAKREQLVHEAEALIERELEEAEGPNGTDSEPEQFTVSNVEWSQVTPSDLGTGRIPPVPIKGAPQAIFVTCRCGHAWWARRHGVNGLVPVVGAIRLGCPSCGVQGTVPNATLKDF